MAKPRMGKKVTFSVPDDLLKLADLQAELMGLERYDILRMAIAQGLVVLRIQHEIVSDPDTYKQELVALSSGLDDASTKAMADKLGANMVKGVQAQLDANEQKPA